MGVKTIIAMVLLAVIGVLGASSLFTVHQATQAIVFQFGDPRRVIQEPGLHWKLPFVQEVILYDKRVLDLDPTPEEIPLADQKRISVDVYARYRISDPLEFHKTVRTEIQFVSNFGRILNAATRDVVGNALMEDLLSEKRTDLMAEITGIIEARAPDFGVEIVDVRIGRTDLPQEISANVYERMRSERVQQANRLRAEGTEINQTITAQADRERTVILAEARRQAQILQGEGDAQRNRILGTAYGQDPEFFSFYRSMQAYREALGGEGTSMVLTPDSEFFKHFGSGSTPTN